MNAQSEVDKFTDSVCLTYPLLFLQLLCVVCYVCMSAWMDARTDACTHVSPCRKHRGHSVGKVGPECCRVSAAARSMPPRILQNTPKSWSKLSRGWPASGQLVSTSFHEELGCMLHLHAWARPGGQEDREAAERAEAAGGVGQWAGHPVEGRERKLRGRGGPRARPPRVCGVARGRAQSRPERPPGRSSAGGTFSIVRIRCCAPLHLCPRQGWQQAARISRRSRVHDFQTGSPCQGFGSVLKA